MINDKELKLWQEYCLNDLNEKSKAQVITAKFLNLFNIELLSLPPEIAHNEFTFKNGYVDFYWKSNILIEWKAKGRNLEEAFNQAHRYCDTLSKNDLPKIILISDFVIWRIYDSFYNLIREFDVRNIKENMNDFLFLIDSYNEITNKEKELKQLNLNASHKLSELYEEMIKSYPQASVYILRLINLFYWDSCNLIKDRLIYRAINRSGLNGEELGKIIDFIFRTVKNYEREGLNDDYLSIPFEASDLFFEDLPRYNFDINTRKIVSELIEYDWRRIRPLIYGSLFQGCMSIEERHNFGAHFTSRENILKLLNPLLLNDFRNLSNGGEKTLEILHKLILSSNYLDPACGSGNFLSVLLTELWDIEEKIIRIIGGKHQLTLNNFHGFEINEYAANIAVVALNVTYHQLSGVWPKDHHPSIYNGNALTKDWNSENVSYSYIFGNPPFISSLGQRSMNQEQKNDLQIVFNGNAGRLDYCTGWFKKADDYIQNVNECCQCAFIATAAVKAPSVAEHFFSEIKSFKNFAYSPFDWKNGDADEALTKVIVLGIGKEEEKHKYLDDESVSFISPLFSEFEPLKKIKKAIGFKNLFASKNATSTNPVSCEPTDIIVKQNLDVTGELVVLYRITNVKTQVKYMPNGTFFEYAILNSTIFEKWCKTFVNSCGGGLIHLSVDMFNAFPIPEFSQGHKDAIIRIGEAYFNNKSKEIKKELNLIIETAYNLNELSEKQKISKLYKMYKDKI